MHFQDMKIQIHYRKVDIPKVYRQKLGFPDDEYFGIQVTESRRGEMPQPEIIPSTQDRKDTIEPLLEQLEKERKRMSLDEVARLGQALTNLLFYGTVRDLLVRCLDYADDHGEGLRLRLVLKDPQAARLPWEYVYFQRVTGEKATWSGFLALDPHISIVRHEPMLVPSRSVVTQQRPLKIFVAFAEPEGVGEDLEQEIVRHDIVEALKEEIVVGRIDLSVDEHLKVNNLDAVAGFGIFSFSGHGAYLTEDELAYYREKYRVKEDGQAEAEAEPEPQETTLRRADRAKLKAGFARRQESKEAATLRRADRDALRAGFARRPKPRPRAEGQDEPEDAVLRRADRENGGLRSASETTVNGPRATSDRGRRRLV